MAKGDNWRPILGRRGKVHRCGAWSVQLQALSGDALEKYRAEITRTIPHDGGDETRTAHLELQGVQSMERAEVFFDGAELALMAVRTLEGG